MSTVTFFACRGEPDETLLGVHSLVVCSSSECVCVFTTAFVLAEPPSPAEADAQLVAAAQRYLGRRGQGLPLPTVPDDAWNLFDRRYAPLIRHLVRRAGARNGDVEDCVQDVWLELARSLVRFDDERAPFTAWLRTLVLRTTRRRLRGTVLTVSTTVVEEPICHRGSDPVGAAELREGQIDAWRALAKFGQQVCRTSSLLLLWCSIEDRPASEVADRLGLTPQQVWKQHHRAKQKFRRFLQDAAVVAVSPPQDRARPVLPR